VSVFLGHGNGTFREDSNYISIGQGPDSLAFADVNGDGKLDLLVANVCADTTYCLVGRYNYGSVGVLPGKGNGSFIQPPGTTTSSSSGGQYANSEAVADLNKDGKPDVVVANECSSIGDCKTGSVAVLLGVPAKTTTKVTTSRSPSLIGQPVTFKAAITGAYGSVPNGVSVAFYDGYGPTTIGTGTTNNGVATFTTSELTAKTPTIRAVYPSSAFFKSGVGTVQQVVNLYDSTTTLTSSPNPSASGQAVKFVAKISSSPGGLTGTVTFKQASSTLGTATLSGGNATLSTTKLPVGTLTITATYNGDAKSAESSGTISQTVK
jgi:hypothetical protein